MNKKQFEIWEKQKRRDCEIELEKLREDFSRRGLLFSGARNKMEEDLKNKYESEIEIMRSGVERQTGGGIFLEVGGDMINHGVIQTASNSVVSMAVAGNYSSNDKTKIIQGESLMSKKTFLERPLGIIIVTIIATIVSGAILFLLGLN